MELVQKCKNAEYQFATTNNLSKNSKLILRNYGLIDEDAQVGDAIRRIVLNSIEGSGLSLKVVNPLQKKVSVIDSKTEGKS